MAKIYVSSTFIDLEEYRKQVRTSLRSMGHEDVAMEYYTAGEKAPLEKCLDDVASADIYVGIFALRYGYIPNEQNQSITEQEYRKSIELEKPCFIFMLKDGAPWPTDQIEFSQYERIKELRTELCNEHMVGMFTDRNDLSKQVTTAIYNWAMEHGHIPEYAETNQQINIDKYYSTIRQRYSVLALEGLTPPQKEEYLQINLRSIFVEQSVRESPPPIELTKELWERLKQDREIYPDDLPSGISLNDFRRAREAYYKKPTNLVIDILGIPRYQHTIILGDPGSGKSTLARYIMLSLINPDGDEKIHHAFDGYLPLLIELRSYIGMCTEGNCANFLEFLDYLGKTEGYGLTKTGIHDYLNKKDRALVIFDGLDEIFEPEKREQITNQIVGFCNDYPNTHIIVTSRVIGYRRKILADAGFTHFTLQDLDEKKVVSFVTRWYELAMSERPEESKERCQRIIKSFHESSSIRQLAGNPMLLTIMAIIGKHQELPRERWKLYEHAASVLIQHWDINKHLQSKHIETDFVGEDDKKELLRRLAFHMQSHEGGLAGNYIHHDGLQAEFENYLIERYRQSPDRAKIVARTMIQQFRERNFILSLYGANLYGFVHRAFLEYFCADAFVYNFEKTKELSLEQLKTEVYKKHWEDQSWHEVLRLICGMVNEKWGGEIIENILEFKNTPRDNSSYEDLILKGHPYHDYDQHLNIGLAVQCLGEVRNLSLITETASRVLSAICKMFDNREVSPFVSSSFFQQQIIPTTELIGSNWPNRIYINTWLEQRPPNEKKKNTEFSLADYGIDPKSIGIFIGLVGSGLRPLHNTLLKYIKHKNHNDRLMALSALAKGWNLLPDTISTLRLSALKDKISNVRLLSAKLLIKDYHHLDDNLLLVFQIAKKDKDPFVRREILSNLVEKFKDLDQIYILVKDRVSNDSSHHARADAIIALAKHWPNHPNTPLLIKQRVDREKNIWVKSVATNLANKIYKTINERQDV